MADTTAPYNTGNLQVTTPNNLDIIMKREFSASQAMVYKALTQPDMIRRWFAPQGWTFMTCDVDLRVGGDWRFVMHGPDGKPLGTRGRYTDLAPNRIGFTKQFDDFPGETLVTTALAERSGKTHLTTTVHHTTQTIRDAVLQHGWTPFYVAVFESLEATLKSLDIKTPQTSKL